MKSETQQAVLCLHRLRAHLVSMRIMLADQLRGLWYEFGIVLRAGHRAPSAALPSALSAAEAWLSAMLIDSLRAQVHRVDRLQAQIAKSEQRLARQLRTSPASRTVAEIPGVGLLTATAIVAGTETPDAFKDAREFVACLVPRRTSTCGRVRQLGVSQCGDACLRNR
jgi:transposase